MLENAGARPWDRDPHDVRILADVAEGRGKIIDSETEVGGYPTVPPTRRAFDPEALGSRDDGAAFADALDSSAQERSGNADARRDEDLVTTDKQTAPTARAAPTRDKTKVTINDIARLANVSKKTVSRVINESPLVRERDAREGQAGHLRARLRARSASARARLPPLVPRSR